jgi:3-hydroxyisobutyrate dehydrogenase
MNVGFVGLGTMGAALVRRLMLSRPMAVYDNRREAIDALVADGAAPAADAASLARASDVIMICVPTSAIVRKVIFGPGGLAEGLSPGKIIIDQTTGDPGETQALARELAEIGVTLIDAPVSGGTRGAVAGTIAIIAGGPREAFDTISSILGEVSPNIVYCGEVGTGHAAKLVQNAVAACNRVITLECAALACKAGLTLDLLPDVINASSGWNGGAERILPALRTDTPTTEFHMGLMVKDLRLATDIGSTAGTPMMVANTVRGLFQICVHEQGFTANLDEIARTVESMAGLKFVDHAG